MKSIREPVERAVVLCLAIALVVIVDLLKPSPAPADKIDIQVTILSAEKRQDHSIDVTAEIANRSPGVTLADNRLTVVPETSEGTYHENKDGKNEGGGTASADDPPKGTPVRELEGSFGQIPPDTSVKIAFTVPSGIARHEPLYVHFESTKLRYRNTEEPRAIRVTVPLSVSD
jgi:hypothetical protein